MVFSDAPGPTDAEARPRSAREAFVTTQDGQRTGYATLIDAVAKTTNNLDFATMRGESSPLAQEGKRQEQFLSVIESRILPKDLLTDEQNGVQNGKSAFHELKMIDLTLSLGDIRTDLAKAGLTEFANLSNADLVQRLTTSAQMMADIAKTISQMGYGSFGPGLENMSNPNMQHKYANLRTTAREITGVVLAARSGMPSSDKYMVGDFADTMEAVAKNKLPEKDLVWGTEDSNLTHDEAAEPEIRINGERLGISIATQARIEGIVDALIKKEDFGKSDRDRAEAAKNIVKGLNGSAHVRDGLFRTELFMDGSSFAEAWKQVVTPDMLARIRNEGKSTEGQGSDNDPLASQEEAIRASIGTLTEANESADGRIAEREAKIADLQKQIEAEREKIEEEIATKTMRTEVIGELQAQAEQQKQQAAMSSEAEEARKTLGEAADDANRQALLRLDRESLLNLLEQDPGGEMLGELLASPSEVVAGWQKLIEIPEEKRQELLAAVMELRDTAKLPSAGESGQRRKHRNVRELLEDIQGVIGSEQVASGRDNLAAILAKANATSEADGENDVLQKLLDRAKALG